MLSESRSTDVAQRVANQVPELSVPASPQSRVLGERSPGSGRNLLCSVTIHLPEEVLE